MFWKRGDIQRQLQGSSVIRQIEKRLNAIKYDYGLVCSIAPEFEEFSLEMFLWARQIVTSRNFSITVDGVKTDALVPFADMLNHKRPRETKWEFNDETKQFTITTLCEIPAGHEVLDSYGKKCNSRFFLSYGFAIEHNCDEDGKCHNECSITVELDPEDALYPTRLALLRNSGTIRQVRLSKTYRDSGTITAFSFLRFAVAAQHELPKLNAFITSGARTVVQPVNRENEIRVLETLRRICTTRLSEYRPINEELDRPIQILLKGEQDILRFYETSVPLFTSLLGEKTMRQAQKQIKKVKDRDCLAYINTVIVPLLLQS